MSIAWDISLRTLSEQQGYKHFSFFHMASLGEKYISVTYSDFAAMGNVNT